MSKDKIEKTNWGKFFEIVLGTVMAFAAIAIVFAGLYLTFGFIKKGFASGNAVSNLSSYVGTFEWVLITIITAIIVAVAFKKLANRFLIR